MRGFRALAKHTLMRRSFLGLMTALLIPHAAHASNDGDLCKNPLGLVVCGSVMAVDALTPRSWATRMEDAARSGNLAELKLLMDNHPASADPMKLLTLAVGNYGQDCTAPERWLEMFAFLLESGVDVTDPRMSHMLETIAGASQCPRRIDALNLWFDKGASARGVSLASRTMGWGPEGPDVLRLLVHHGADPNYRRRGQQLPVVEALRSHDEATVRLLIELGAERPPGF